jgi:hypothetical protein
LPLPEIPRLKRAENQYRLDIKDLGSSDSVPVLIGSGKAEIFLSVPFTRINERRLKGLKSLGTGVKTMSSFSC